MRSSAFSRGLVLGLVTGFVMVLGAPAAADGLPAASPIAEGGGAHCWGQCQSCTSQCAGADVSRRQACAESCRARNTSCCERTGRFSSGRGCGCD